MAEARNVFCRIGWWSKRFKVGAQNSNVGLRGVMQLLKEMEEEFRTALFQWRDQILEIHLEGF